MIETFAEKLDLWNRFYMGFYGVEAYLRSMKTYEKELEVRWSDVDQNRHVRHSAYYDYGAHARIRFFADLGYSGDRMAELNLGPILFKEECSFMRELRAEDTVRVNILKGEINEDASRWTIHHEIYNQNGDKCAHITARGAWIDLEKRKLTVPPADLAETMLSLAQGEEFVYGKKG